MKVRTYMSTDWIEVHDKDLTYMAKVFLTDDDRAYVITVQNGKKRLFKVDPRLLKKGELRFFEKVMESAEEMLPEQVFEMELIRNGECAKANRRRMKQ